MLQIKCPYCGLRAETEFRYGGEAHRKRPEKPEKLDDTEWADYLYMRANVKGPFNERWVHIAGCRQWFNAVRDTVSNQLLKTSKISET